MRSHRVVEWHVKLSARTRDDERASFADSEHGDKIEEVGDSEDRFAELALGVFCPNKCLRRKISAGIDELRHS